MKIKILYVVTSTRKCGPIQQTLNNIKYLDRNIFDPYLITIYPEDATTSQLEKFIPLVKHFYVPTNKMQILMHMTSNLALTIKEINPDVIHSLGVFPDFAISMMHFNNKQIITIRNYVWDDYPKRLGLIKGYILCKLQLYAIKKATKAVTCSQSLTKIYKEKMGLNFEYVRNGVDIEKFTDYKFTQKDIRSKLVLPKDRKIFVYSGPIIPRKNHIFLIEAFLKYTLKYNVNDILLILGDGSLYNKISQRYSNCSNIVFRGNVINIIDYLQACDYYVSSSKSEGLPNSVLEAIATKLPVLLSDIPQHEELFDIDTNIGLLYKHDNMDDLIEKLYLLRNYKYKQVNLNEYSAEQTSKNYQKLYYNIASI